MAARLPEVERIALDQPSNRDETETMNGQRVKKGWTDIPLVRQSLIGIGFILIALTPLVGPIPGPGGVIVFAAGAGLVLKYSGWAKRFYVRFKRRHPNKGRWADWSLRRASARRREELRKAEPQMPNEAGEPTPRD